MTSSKFILFYMIGCGFCEIFEPTWAKLQNKYGNKYEFIKCEQENLNNSIEAKGIKKQLNIEITGFPSIFCKVGEEYHKYEGNRTEKDLLNFIESKSEKSDEIENEENEENISISDNSAKNVKLYYFYMNQCKWCQQFESIWNELKTKFDNYECENELIHESNEAEIIKSTLNLKIDSYPCIFIKINNLYYKYNGPRTMNDVLRFIAEVIKKNKLIQRGGKINYRNKYKKYKQMYIEVLDKFNKLNKYK